MKLHAMNEELKCNRKGNRNVTLDWKEVNCIYCINNKFESGAPNEYDVMENYYSHFWVLKYIEEYNEGHFGPRMTVKQALIRWINGKVECDGNCEYARFESEYASIGKKGGCTPENHAGIGQAIEDCDKGIY